MSELLIQDNAIPEREQNYIKNVVTSYDLPWFYNETTAWDKDTKNQRPQFCHYLFYDNYVGSKYFQEFMNCLPIPEINNGYRLNKLKLNLTMPWKNRSVIKPHTDLNGAPGITYLYYPITSDGPTIVWRNRWRKQKIDPIQGRLVRMSGDMLHTGSNPHKYDRRIVLNIVLEKT